MLKIQAHHAGSERVKHTGNTGERLGESKSINSSLMTLRYCLENLRWNQKNSGAKPRQLPFRESKVRPNLLMYTFCW